jgi:hypothetical protein
MTGFLKLPHILMDESDSRALVATIHGLPWKGRAEPRLEKDHGWPRIARGARLGRDEKARIWIEFGG